MIGDALHQTVSIWWPYLNQRSSNLYIYIGLILITKGNCCSWKSKLVVLDDTGNKWFITYTYNCIVFIKQKSHDIRQFEIFFFVIHYNDLPRLVSFTIHTRWNIDGYLIDQGKIFIPDVISNTMTMITEHNVWLNRSSIIVIIYTLFHGFPQVETEQNCTFTLWTLL